MSDMTPGFRSMVGRKSGRPSPRAPIRQPAREATLVKHGLMEAGTGDVNQGHLFNGQQFEVPVEEMAQRAGVAPPLPSSRGGFLPGIEASPSGSKSAHQRKVDAIQSFAETRAANPIDVPTMTKRMGRRNPPQEYGQQARHLQHMENLASAAPATSNWYTEGGTSAGPGQAVEGITQAAQRTNSTMAQMTRATAQISPRVPWSTGNPNYRSMPNLESAENVGRAVRERETRNPGVQAREATLERLGQGAPGIALPLSKARAAVSMGSPGVTSTPLPAGENYAKVPNFNESLSIGQEQIPTRVRAGYAGSYTSDMWDLQAKNLPENFHSKQGQYEVDKMLSARSAFKRRELPSHQQARVWSKERSTVDPEPLTASVDVGGGSYRKQPSLFSEDQFSRKLSPSFDFSRSKEGSVPDPRRLAGGGAAARMGLEF